MSSSDRLALAVDLGTTTIAASLLDLATGDRLATAGSLNPQRAYGADVVSRLAAACRSIEARQQMSEVVRGELRRLATELLTATGYPPEALARIAIAGNPAMEHLLLDLPVESLAFPPYRPLFTAGRIMTARELGWNLPATLYLFPLPGGFVGGDTVAFLYDTAAPLPAAGSSRLYLDLGTNGEIVLQAGDILFATSAAAGPAFEGGNLACGMPALPGAISTVAATGGRLALTVIDGKPPLGICGSGVLDTIALLLETGIVDRTGRLLPAAEIASPLGDRVREVAGQPAFVLHRDALHTVYLSQEDIRQVQLAKGAIRAGIEVLCGRAGIDSATIAEVVLTGSFGVVLAPRSLKNIGIFTEMMVHTTRFVREGALRGVERTLLEGAGEAAVETLAGSFRVIPLSGTPAFEKSFLEHINFPDIER
ncbi:hypothetical protein GURASL_06620 [Geotalea uraniireducens]|uniref:DUF4445 domain-containing protein n=1 Tax=Geotalea uraniireducens TaxID=351604 RepID=A0ABM8EH32_9BACT|nr:ASKHA domain-containing protein [Geotalea uraniireducens]BDV41739.1 hypothetical protein GURASL_06620 [Geotalea uraniireducens]